MASKIFPVILIAVVIWLGSQVWRDSSDGLRQEAVKPAPTVKLIPASSRPAATDFTLESTKGERVQLSSFRGRSAVVLNFFTTG